MRLFLLDRRVGVGVDRGGGPGDPEVRLAARRRRAGRERRGQQHPVNQITFDLGSTLKGTPIRKSSAKAKLRVDNNGFIDAEVGVAVVVFDEEGNVVATGSGGTQWGYLNKGDRAYYTVALPLRLPQLRPREDLPDHARDRGEGPGQGQGEGRADAGAYADFLGVWIPRAWRLRLPPRDPPSFRNCP